MIDDCQRSALGHEARQPIDRADRILRVLSDESESRSEEHTEYQSMGQLCPAEATNHDWLRLLYEPKQAARNYRKERDERDCRQEV